MVRPISGQLADLSARTKQAEDAIARAAPEGKADPEARKAEMTAGAKALTGRIMANLRAGQLEWPGKAHLDIQEGLRN